MDLTKYLNNGIDLLTEANKPLKDISSVNVLDKTFEKNEETESGDFKFSFEAGGGLKIDVYNDENDDDEDELVSDLTLDHYINDEQKAFLKYQLSARIKGKTGFGVQAIQLGFALEKSVTFSSYLIHQQTESLGEATQADLSSLAMVFDKEKLAEISIGSVATMSITSKAEFSGEVEWADAVSTGLGTISDLIGASVGLELSFSAGAKLGFDCAVAGDFQVIVQRKAADSFFVDVRKKKSLSTTGAASLGVTAEIANDEDQLTEIVDTLFDKVQKGITEELKPLLENAKNALSEAEKKVIHEAAIALGIDDADLDKIKEKYTDKKDKVKEKLVEVLETKISAGVALEYSRVKSKETLFSATFSKEELLQHHRSIFTLKIAPLVDIKKGSEGFNYTQITQLSVKKTFGINLSVGNWKAESKNENTLDLTREETLDEDTTSFKISNLSIGKSHEVSVGKKDKKNAEKNSILLSAKMPEPVTKKAEATISKFDFELKLTSDTSFKEIGIIELRQLIDFGVLLNLITPDDYEDVYGRWKTRVLDKKMSYELLLSVPFGLFDTMMDEIADASDLELSRSMAAAMPYLKLPGRSDINTRINVYLGFFKKYLDTKDSSLTIQNWETTLGHYLSENNYQELSDFESSQTSGPWSNKNQYSFVGCFEFQGVENNLYGFQKALNLLESSPNKSYEIIKKKVKQKINWIKIGNDYTFRLFCRLIIDMAQKAGISNELEKSIQIKYKDDNGKEVTTVLIE